MSLQVEQIRDNFASVKKMGSTAEDLANDILDIYSKSVKTTQYFEEKMSDTNGEFMHNLQVFSSPEAVQYATNVYMILKEMNTKIEALG